MGTAHKVLSACFRILELACSAIILGILARFFYLLNAFHGPSNSRLEYAISMAAISLFLAIIVLPPFAYSFWFFPIDIALFVCWIVCFALLEDLSGTYTCTSSWFLGYWAVFWNTGTGNTVVVTRSGCSEWRAVLAFSFIVSFIWLMSFFLGAYVCMHYYHLGDRSSSKPRKFTLWKKKNSNLSDPEKSAAHPAEQQLLNSPGPTPALGHPQGPVGEGLPNTINH